MVQGRMQVERARDERAMHAAASWAASARTVPQAILEPLPGCRLVRRVAGGLRDRSGPSVACKR